MEEKGLLENLQDINDVLYEISDSLKALHWEHSLANALKLMELGFIPKTLEGFDIINKLVQQHMTEVDVGVVSTKAILENKTPEEIDKVIQEYVANYKE